VAVVPLDEPARSTGKLTLQDLRPATFADLLPQTADVTGRVSGALVLAPTTDERAPEPTRLDAQLTVDEGAWRSVALKSLAIEAYVGSRRSVLQSAVFEFGDGSATLWGSTNDHDGDRYVQLSGEVSAVDLRQIVGAFTPDAERYEGRISGTFGGAGYLGESHRSFGSATISVTDSDLIEIALINSLYSLFSVRETATRDGIGVAEVRLDGNTLYVPRAEYFNRGLELTASLAIADIFAGGDSPVTGVAVGTARPLAGAEVPLVEGGVDRIFSAAQAGGTVASIGGTLREPVTRIVSFADLRGFMARILGPAGQ
jgi:hypothetical protein